MELKIVSPFSESTIAIEWIELNTPAGNFVIQPGHAPTILPLMPNQLVTFCLRNGKRESICVKDGIAEISRIAVKLLISQQL